MTVDLVLATHNAHKVREVQEIVARLAPGVRLVGWTGDAPVEDGVTFAENALIKARAASADTGLPALADDSGIAVDVMGGSPGILSARWSGRHGDDVANRELLLAQLRDVARAHRGAAFVCALALVGSGGIGSDGIGSGGIGPSDAEPVVVEGRWAGRIAEQAAGTGGFGYDPVFVPDGHEISAAELDPALKNGISHRARAFAALAPSLRTLAGE